MAERQRALARELWLQRLMQLGKLQDLLWEAADIGRSDCRRAGANSGSAGYGPD